MTSDGGCLANLSKFCNKSATKKVFPHLEGPEINTLKFSLS